MTEVLSLVVGLTLLCEQVHPDPPLQDLMRFPCKESVQGALELGRQHKEWVRDNQAVAPTGVCTQYWDAWIACCKGSLEPWEMLEKAQCDDTSDEWRRAKLRQLLETLGPLDYYGGKLPPPVPLSRFKIILTRGAD